MDILIMANQPVLDLIRNFPGEASEDIEKEEWMKLIEKIDKGEQDGGYIQEISI